MFVPSFSRCSGPSCSIPVQAALSHRLSRGSVVLCIVFHACLVLSCQELSVGVSRCRSMSVDVGCLARANARTCARDATNVDGCSVTFYVCGVPRGGLVAAVAAFGRACLGPILREVVEWPPAWRLFDNRFADVSCRPCPYAIKSRYVISSIEPDFWPAKLSIIPHIQHKKCQNNKKRAPLTSAVGGALNNIAFYISG